MAFQLRDYQTLNEHQIREAFHRVQRVMYQAGTGSGKTVTATSIVEKAVAKGSTVWFVAHRRELIEQASRAFYNNDIRNGIIMAGYKYNPHLRVQICSIDTLRERLFKNNKLVVNVPPNLLVVDEAHRSLSPSYIKLFDWFPRAFLLGLSATPIRSDGRGLGHAYDEMVQAPSVAELIEAGWLVQPRYFTGATADMKGVATGHDNDYARAEAEARMNNAVLRGDVVEQWLRHANGRKTIVFAVGVKHSIALKDDFLAAGISAMHIDGNTMTNERMDLFEEFRHTDKWSVLCNCNIATEGVDIPEVSCISIATPTKIISKYLQMGGRGLRIHPESGKKDCIIIDHGGNIGKRHGFLEDPVPWTLGTEGRITDRIAKARERLAQIFKCHMCGCEFSGKVRCPECGTRLEVQGQHELISTAEELIEVTRGAAGVKAKDEQKTYTMAQKRSFYAQVCGYAQGMNPRRKKYSDGWVGHTYRAKFGVWPQKGGARATETMKPTPEVVAFIRAKFAAYHIRKNIREQTG
jgi:superfamily II DNA or RNA helicase